MYGERSPNHSTFVSETCLTVLKLVNVRRRRTLKWSILCWNYSLAFSLMNSSSGWKLIVVLCFFFVYLLCSISRSIFLLQSVNYTFGWEARLSMYSTAQMLAVLLTTFARILYVTNRMRWIYVIQLLICKMCGNALIDQWSHSSILILPYLTSGVCRLLHLFSTVAVSVQPTAHPRV